ncbi:hypothetical protein Tco_0964690 [Tanacetum coccineum]
MANNRTKLTTKEFAANNQANYYLVFTSIKVNGKNAYELKGKFLDDLHNNAFSGTNGEDAVEHIEYFLRIVDPIDLPNVSQDKLRVLIFPISLVEDAWRWFDKIKGSINKEERCKVFDNHERPVCYIRRFEIIKYSIKDDEECVAIKEKEYDDLINTSKDAIHAYQEIFRMMDEGWMVTHTE